MFSQAISAVGGYVFSGVKGIVQSTLDKVSEEVTTALCTHFGSAELNRSQIQAIVHAAATNVMNNLIADASISAIMSLNAQALVQRLMLELMSEALLGIYSTNAHHPQDGHKLSMSSIAGAYEQLRTVSLADLDLDTNDKESAQITTDLMPEALALALVKELRNRTANLKPFLKDTTEYHQLMEKLNSKELTSQQKIEQYAKYYMQVRHQLKNHTMDKGNPFLRKLGHFVMTLLTAGIYGVAMAARSYKQRSALSFWKSDSEVQMHRLERRIPRLG